MKHSLLLYGPPGVGKLTVGKQLASQTNYKLFHVHLLADLVHAIFDFGTKEFVDSFIDIWCNLYNRALQSSTKGIIVTLVYGVQTLKGKNDGKFIKKIIAITKKNNAVFHCIKLECDEDALLKRVQSKTRKRYQKITDLKTFKKIRQDNPKIDQAIPLQKSLIIDTTKLTPTQTAQKIINELKITTTKN